MADKPNVGPDPVEAKPNHVREKTYKTPNAPPKMEEEVQKLPKETTKEEVRRDLPKAVDQVKERL